MEKDSPPRWRSWDVRKLLLMCLSVCVGGLLIHGVATKVLSKGWTMRRTLNT